MDYNEYIKPFRTPAVDRALQLVRDTGQSAHPQNGERVSNISRVVSLELDSAETQVTPLQVQAQIEAYADARDQWPTIDQWEKR